MEALVMGSFKRVFDPLDLEIIDRVYEVAWAHVQAHQPNRDTASDGKRQEALRKKIFGVARIMGSGHIDFEPLTEVVLAIPGLSMPNVERLSEAGDRHVLQREGNVECEMFVTGPSGPGRLSANQAPDRSARHRGEASPIVRRPLEVEGGENG